MRAGLIGLQLLVGALGGWLISAAVLFSAMITCRIVGIPPRVGDLVAMGVMILWAVASVIVATVVYNRRLRWLPVAVGFTLAAVVFAFFAVVIVIPFGAGMRDFD